MTIRLQAESEKFIAEQVRAGKFASEEEAISAAVDQMREREEKLAWLRRELQIGVDQIERGDCAEWDVEEIKGELRKEFPGI